MSTVKFILEFIFQDFWHFAGTCLILSILCHISLFRVSVRSDNDKTKEKE